MPAEPTEIIACPSCGTKNRIRAGVSGGTFRCASCQTPLRPSRPPSLAARLISGAPEFFCRTARALVALVLFAIPGWIAYYSFTNPAPTVPTTAKATPKPLPPPADATPKFDPDKWLAENSPPTPPPFAEPELLLPPTGEFRGFTTRTRLAPFQIKSSTGTHYLIKLDDSRTGAPIQTIFVRGGTTVEVDVPLGSYTVKYASGSKWYGYKHLFGPNASYSRASTLFTFSTSADKYRGHTITLYTVPNGNLHMAKIDADEF